MSMSVTPVTGFRIPEDELELLDEAAVCRSELVRFLIVSGLDRPGGDLAGGERKNLLREWRREVSA